MSAILGTPCARPGRVSVPPHVRRVFADFGKKRSMRTFGISGGTFDEFCSVYGLVQEKTLIKIEAKLAELNLLKPLELTR